MEQINKTPYFLINQILLDENVDNLNGAIEKYWKNTIVGYSFKTNSLVAVCDYMKKAGYFAEVVSDDEYKLAKYLGFDKNKIIYNGPCKEKDSLIELLDNGGIINLDSNREVDWVIEYAKDTTNKVNVGLRVNFDLETMCPNETAMGFDGSRFGFSYENGDLEKVIKKLKINNVAVTGIHLHNSSRTRSLKIYDAISTMACEIKNKLNLDLDYVDIGGGFFGGDPNKVDFYDYFEVITKNLLKVFGKNLTLIVEPGCSLIASPIKYVTSVIDVKDNPMGNRIVLTDGSRIHIDPLMQKSRYDYLLDANAEIINKQNICGFTCMEHDILMSIDNMPELKVGDKIIYNKVGSYTLTLSPLFISYYPEVYWLNKNGEIKIVRNKWTIQDVVQDQEVIK